jgi:hypothetical protein
MVYGTVTHEGIQGSKFSPKVPTFEDEQQAKSILTKPYFCTLLVLGEMPSYTPAAPPLLAAVVARRRREHALYHLFNL